MDIRALWVGRMDAKENITADKRLPRIFPLVNVMVTIKKLQNKNANVFQGLNAHT